MRAMNFSDESGSAALELLVFGVLLQVPILAIATQFAGIQHQQLAAQTMSQQGLRAYVQSTATVADENLKRAMDDMSQNFGLSSGDLSYALSCLRDCNGAEPMLSLRVSVGKQVETSVMFGRN